MSLIRSKNTKPELSMARLLRRAHIGYRRNVRKLPGCPDFVIAKARIALFVDGNFWHGKNFSVLAKKLKPFWHKKISNNRKRDRFVNKTLRGMGWIVLRFWEDEIKMHPRRCLGKIRSILSSSA